jgi:hypothetical protein
MVGLVIKCIPTLELDIVFQHPLSFWQTRTIATKACMKSKRPRDLPGSRSNISGRRNPISFKSIAISAEKREIKPMSNTLRGKGVLERNIPSQVVVHL